MTCQQTQDLLHGYLDGELDLVSNIEIERHLETCQTCTLARQKQLKLRALIKEGAPYFQAPDLLTKRVKNAARAASSAPAKSTPAPRHWLAIAASVAVLGLSGLLLWTITSNWRRHEVKAE
jgi:anti-sigma factor RsiW